MQISNLKMQFPKKTNKKTPYRQGEMEGWMEDVSAVIDPSRQAYYKSDSLALNANWLELVKSSHAAKH